MLSEQFLRTLEQKLGKHRVHRAFPLAPLTTFRIGGPAECLVQPSSQSHIEAVVHLCSEAGADLRILGSGSDLLVSDEGVPGVVMRLAENWAHMSIEGSAVHALAGCSNAALVEAACCAGLSGYEFACGIPGTLGGAAIMNAGAYGGEFKEACVSLTCLTPQGQVQSISSKQASWSYRHSMMDDERYLVLELHLSLRRQEPELIRQRIDEFTKRRQEKQPLSLPSAGSTFKRPEGHYVGQLVQEAGLRGYTIGGIQVSEKHTGFIVNAKGGTAKQVRELIAYVQQRVYEHSGIRLIPEVRMWGFESENDTQGQGEF